MTTASGAKPGPTQAVLVASPDRILSHHCYMYHVCDRGNVKFILDGMLGKLSRWLRMLGHDVKYTGAFDDDALIEIATTERRILLTRDVELYQRATRAHAEVVLVDGTNEAERLGLLAMRFGLSLEFDPTISRCPKCNSGIGPAREEDVAWKIPPSTREFHHHFWECPQCGKVYWQGAHWVRIARTLDEAKRIAKSEKRAYSPPSNHFSGTS